MSTQLLPITHPDIQRHIAWGTKAGNRASVLQFQSQFLVGEEQDRLLYIAECEIAVAQHQFTRAHQRADYSEPDVRLSSETWRAFEAERERAAKFSPCYKPEARPRSDQGGKHNYPKRGTKAA